MAATGQRCRRRGIFVKKTVLHLIFRRDGGIVMILHSSGVMVERLRQRFAKPVLVGSTPTHASNFFAPSLRQHGSPSLYHAASFAFSVRGAGGFREKSGTNLDFRWNRGIFRAPLIIGFRRLFASGQIPIGKIIGGYLQAATLKSSCIVPFVRTLKIHSVELSEIPFRPENHPATGDRKSVV